MSDSLKDNNLNSYSSEIFRKTWLKLLNFDTPNQPPDIIIESLKNLEDSHLLAKEMVVVLESSTFTPLYITKNIENILGYTPEEFIGWGKNAILKIGGYEQKKFLIDLLKWSKDFIEINADLKDFFTRVRGFYGGRIYKHKDGSSRKFLNRFEMQYRENYSLPNTVIVHVEDITHLIKNNDYWALYQKFTESKEFSRLYTKNGIVDNIISEREKEILILIASGMTSKEVAKKLFISPETVSQHRKNMIKRLNAKDTSSLVQLCKMCEII